MKKITSILVTLMFVLVATSFFASSALAYRGDFTVKSPNYSLERHTAILKAFEDNDYEMWKNIMQNRGRVSQIITEANFKKLVEAHNLALQGKTIEAQKIRQEIGLGLKNGSGRDFGGMRMCKNFNR